MSTRRSSPFFLPSVCRPAAPSSTSRGNFAVAEKSIDDTATGFFRFLTESGRYKCEMPVVSESAHKHDTVRMTLDYPQDLEFFSAVYRELDQRPGWTFADLVALFHARPDLVALNQGLDEAYKAHFQAGLAR